MSAAARKNSSILWRHYEKDNDSGKAVCNICIEKISYKTTISNLRSHLKRKHISTFTSLVSEEKGVSESTRAVENEGEPDTCSNLPSTSSVLPSTSSSQSHLPPAPKRQRVLDTYVHKKISLEQKKKIDRDLLDLCILGFHPFSLVEERSFIKYSRWIPGYKLPTRKTLSNSLLQEAYMQTEHIVKKQVAEEVQTMCITTDLWTSRVTESYIAVTGHYITKT